MSSKFAQNFNKVSLIFGQSLAAASFITHALRARALAFATKDSANKLAKEALNYNDYEHAALQENASALVKTNNNPYRPRQWDDKDLVYAKTSVADYFFDAVFKVDHTSTLKITEHPIQNGANVADHAFLLPARVVLEIGMSDCMDSVVKGQFTGNKSKSISAYKTLKQLQAERIPLKLTTRLDSYANMLIEQISTPDDFKTLTGLRCSITLKQVNLSEVDVVLVSARPQVTSKPRATAAQPKQPDSTVAAKIEASAFGSSPNQPLQMLKSH